ncbi:MAG TPA: hypothetical protein VKV73_12300 [Chloroflexota bacterium]|nr:hypothetical protein [Chloroflexota bacterium]
MGDPAPRQTNPALAQLAVFEGEWQMELANASFLPDPGATVRGHMSGYWALDGAFLVMRQGDREPSPPAALWLIGRDEALDGYEVLYFDARHVSRIYRMSFVGRTWKMWREAPSFWQRFECTVAENGSSMAGHWDRSMDDGASWQHDFDVAYVKKCACA